MTLLALFQASSLGTGYLTATEAADTLNAVGAVAITGSETTTEARDTLSASSVLAIVATMAATEAADTVSSASTRVPRPIFSRVAAGGSLRLRSSVSGGARLKVH